MASPYRTRTYSQNDWAVKTWDWFNGDSTTAPTSFCQFWRTVLLWASLARIPFLGKAFLGHLATQEPKMSKTEEFLADILADILPPIGRGVALPFKWLWTLLWPLRQGVYYSWRGLASLVAYIDKNSSDWLDTLDKIAKPVMIGLAVAAGGMIIFLSWLLLYELWRAVDYRVFISLVIGVPLLAMIAFFSFPRMLDPFIDLCAAIWSFISSIFRLLWNAIVAGKHRICPPIEIRRS